MNTVELFHSLGEEKMSFETHAGQVFLEASGEAMTPFGGYLNLTKRRRTGTRYREHS